MERYIYEVPRGSAPDAPLRIESIAVLWIEDEVAPANLGTYSDEPGPGAIDRHALGDWQPHEFRYFNPPAVDAASPEDAMNNYRRYQAYCDNQWSQEGCIAVATASYPIGAGCRRLQELQSGGLWGIESDSSARYKLEVELEQLEDLKEHVKVFGIPWTQEHEAILAAIKEDIQQASTS